MTEGVATPASWRVVTGGALAGGLFLGARAGSGRWSGAVLAGSMMAALASVVPIAMASRRPPIPVRDEPPMLDGDTADAGVVGSPPWTSDGGASQPTFTVVVAGRDEAAVLPRLVGDVAAQDHRTPDGRPLFELIVIDDRSRDGTAQLALRTAAATGIGDVTRLVRRAGEVADGKGAALTALAPEAYRGDVVVVLDADARIGPAFLSTLAHYVERGARAITARRRILGADLSWLSGAQGDEQTIDGELQRGRWSRGGLSEFRGNGIVVERGLLIEVGGWRAEALTEDLDLSSRIAAARGISVAWALDAEVWEEPVLTWPSLWRQRVRWAEGSLRRLLEHGPAVLRSRRLTPAARLDFAAYAGQVLAPPVMLGALIGMVARRRFGWGALLLGGYGAVAGALGWDALRWEVASDGEPLARTVRARRAVRAAVFGTLWLATVPAAMWRLATRRGPVVYDKMEHEGHAGLPSTPLTASVADPEPAPVSLG